VSLHGVDTIGDLLQQLEVYVPPRDVIVGVCINGDEYDCGPTSEVYALPLDGVDAIELRTASPETFARDARGRVGEYLKMISTRFERAVESFDRGVEMDALDYYRLGVEELRLLVTLWERLKHIDGAAADAVAGIKAELQGVCDALLVAQEGNDLVAVRSLLADAMLPLLRRGWGPDQAAGQEVGPEMSEEPT
jgi:hypothetical protein